MIQRTVRTRALTALAGVASLSLVAAATMGGTAAAAAGDTATIDAGQTFQHIDGFGASGAFGQAASIMNLPAPLQTQALDYLYSPSAGAGLTMERNEIGATSGKTIEPTAPANPSATPTYIPFSADGNDQGQLSLVQAVKSQLGVSLNVHADAWSAPPFMKDNNSVTNGGTLCGSPGAKACTSGDWRQAYANYLVQYAKDYADAGVPLTYIGFENEANLAPTYDGMVMTPQDNVDFIKVLGPTLAASGLPTKLECCAAEGSILAAGYAKAIADDPVANSYIPLFTSHSYTTNPDEPPLFSPVQNWSKPSWETEFSALDGEWNPAWDDGSDASGLTWADNIYKGLSGANLSAYFYWWGATSPLYAGNQGLILVAGDAVTDSGRLWAFANYSRFIHPGATRIGAAVNDSKVELTAVHNADGSVAIVAVNDATAATPVTFSLKGMTVADGTTVTPYLTDAADLGQSSAAPAVDQVAAQTAVTVAGGSFAASLPARSVETFVFTPATVGADLPEAGLPALVPVLGLVAVAAVVVARRRWRLGGSAR